MTGASVRPPPPQRAVRKHGAPVSTCNSDRRTGAADALPWRHRLGDARATAAHNRAVRGLGVAHPPGTWRHPDCRPDRTACGHLSGDRRGSVTPLHRPAKRVQPFDVLHSRGSRTAVTCGTAPWTRCPICCRENTRPCNRGRPPCTTPPSAAIPPARFPGASAASADIGTFEFRMSRSLP